VARRRRSGVPGRRTAVNHVLDQDVGINWRPVLIRAASDVKEVGNKEGEREEPERQRPSVWRRPRRAVQQPVNAYEIRGRSLDLVRNAERGSSCVGISFMRHRQVKPVGALRQCDGEPQRKRARFGRGLLLGDMLGLVPQKQQPMRVSQILLYDEHVLVDEVTQRVAVCVGVRELRVPRVRHYSWCEVHRAVVPGRT
jgi:hypothetical protein